MQAELAKQLDAWFAEYATAEYATAEYATAEYDIWKGGRSKARRLHAPEGHPDYRPLRTE